MITIQKPALSNPVQLSTRPTATPTAEPKRLAVPDVKLTAGMLRIFEQYRAGTYRAADYSTRTCQRHRKYFLSLGIDLRRPFGPSAIISPPKVELRTRPSKKSLPAAKKKQVSAPKSASAISEPNRRKSKCASEALFRAQRSRAQRRRIDRSAGLGVMVRVAK